MSKSFVLLDKSSNLQKNANIIVKFNFNGFDYLIYSINENEQNVQIFVSKLVLNSEGKYFIDNILPEEKGKLNNIVYNIVILIPTDVQKGDSFESLSTNLFDKFAVKLFPVPFDMDMQEYFSSCSVAITSKILVEAAIRLYDENLVKNSQSGDELIPTWTAPTEVTSPTEAPTITSPNSTPVTDPISISNIPVQESNNVQSLDLNLVNTQVPSDVSTGVTSSVDVKFDQSIAESNVAVNPQTEKLAVVSDPSLHIAGVSVQQPNVGKLKKAGFANTKYIVIGTVCFVLAIIVVIVAYILIKNMQ